MQELKLIGIPADGSAPFVMAHCYTLERAKIIFNETAHLYTQELSGWEVHNIRGGLVKQRDIAINNSAPKTMSRAMETKPHATLTPRQFGEFMNDLNLAVPADQRHFRYMLIAANTAARTSHILDSDFSLSGDQVLAAVNGMSDVHGINLEPSDKLVAKNKHRPMIRISPNFLEWLKLWNTSKPIHSAAPRLSVKPTNINLVLQRRFQEAGVEHEMGIPITSRVMRYSIATYFDQVIEGGFKDREVQAFMGHHTNVTTVRYTMWNRTTQLKLITAIEDYLAEAQTFSKVIFAHPGSAEPKRETQLNKLLSNRSKAESAGVLLGS